MCARKSLNPRDFDGPHGGQRPLRGQRVDPRAFIIGHRGLFLVTPSIISRVELRPGEQWICDTCGETILSAKEGWLEWLHTDDERELSYGFRIVHHIIASPNNPNRCGRPGLRAESCYKYDGTGRDRTAHLDHIVALDGIAFLLGLIDGGPHFDGVYKGPRVKNLREWVELFRRLAVPYYEEARLYWERAAADGFFSGMGEEVAYCPTTLKALIEQYGENRDAGQ